MKTTPASNMDVKRRNRTNTLRCILSCERISQMELSQQLALSWPTILQNVKEPVELGLVELVQSVMGDECAGGTLLGVGISLPGIVDSEAGLLRYSHILDLRDVPLDMR